jgi:hypothetical protein
MLNLKYEPHPLYPPPIGKERELKLKEELRFF